MAKKAHVPHGSFMRASFLRTQRHTNDGASTHTYTLLRNQAHSTWRPNLPSYGVRIGIEQYKP